MQSRARGDAFPRVLLTCKRSLRLGAGPLELSKSPCRQKAIASRAQARGEDGKAVGVGSSHGAVAALAEPQHLAVPKGPVPARPCQRGACRRPGDSSRPRRGLSGTSRGKRSSGTEAAARLLACG